MDVEDIDGALAVNGLPMSVSRALGADVPLLAQRLVDQWRVESGAESVRVFQCCGWTVASRLQAGSSQIIQWRSSTGGELLMSKAPLGVASREVPTPRLPLIADCDWSTPVHGQVAQRQFLQVSARCNVEPARALDLVARRLLDTGWRWQRSGSLALHAELGGVQARLIAAPLTQGPPQGAGRWSSIVLIESQPVTGFRR